MLKTIASVGSNPTGGTELSYVGTTLGACTTSACASRPAPPGCRRDTSSTGSGQGHPLEFAGSPSVGRRLPARSVPRRRLPRGDGARARAAHRMRRHLSTDRVRATMRCGRCPDQGLIHSDGCRCDQPGVHPRAVVRVPALLLRQRVHRHPRDHGRRPRPGRRRVAIQPAEQHLDRAPGVGRADGRADRAEVLTVRSRGCRT